MMVDSFDLISLDYSIDPFVLPSPSTSTEDKFSRIDLSADSSSSLPSPSPFYKPRKSVSSAPPAVITIAEDDTDSVISDIPFLAPKR